MNHAHHPVILCCQSNSASAFDVDGAIGLCGRLGQNADEVEDCICPHDRTENTCVIKHIRLDNLR